MLKKKLIVLFLFVLMSTICHAQSQKKTLQTKFTTEKVTVDAKLDEEAWKNAEIATNFVMVEPDNGTLETTERRSEVKIVYNNDAIYVGAILHNYVINCSNPSIRDEVDPMYLQNGGLIGFIPSTVIVTKEKNDSVIIRDYIVQSIVDRNITRPTHNLVRNCSSDIAM